MTFRVRVLTQTRERALDRYDAPQVTSEGWDIVALGQGRTIRQAAREAADPIIEYLREVGNREDYAELLTHIRMLDDRQTPPEKYIQNVVIWVSLDEGLKAVR